MKITIDLLKKMRASQEAIDFVVRNGLEGYPWEKLDEIEGDYKGHIGWLKKHKQLKYEGNKLTYKGVFGDLEEYTYNDKGNLLSYRNSDGFFEEYIYDDKGKLLTRNSNEDFSEEHTYDD